tara:strand:+ start:842 stop:1297 length:456 start_codon:yes stop_codon:yes gene_type:complete
MFMPVDPNSVDGMWDKLLQSLSSQESCIVVSDGKKSDELKNQNFSKKEAEALLVKLKSREYVRIGSSRMSPMPAYFTLNIMDGYGRLMELISLSSDDERLRNDVSLVCQFSFFENKQLEKLVIPLIITDLEDPDLRFEVNYSEGETRAYRI